jgi:hypothetical protein
MYAITAVAGGSSVRESARKLNISGRAMCNYVKSGGVENATERRSTLSPDQEEGYHVRISEFQDIGIIITANVAGSTVYDY